MSVEDFNAIVQRDLDGNASDDDRSVLQANTQGWIGSLLRKLDDVGVSMDSAKRTLKGAERSVVIKDFEAEYSRIDEVLTSLIGPAASPIPTAVEATPTGVAQLQISWTPHRIVVWMGGHRSEPADLEELRFVLAELGAGGIAWEEFRSFKVPTLAKVTPLCAPIGDCLGWLVALVDTVDDDLAGISVAWMGYVTQLAVRLSAAGRVVPTIKKRRKRKTDELPKGSSEFEVRWGPALVEAKEFADLVRAMPACVGVLDDNLEKPAMANAILCDVISSIFSEAASLVEADELEATDPTTKIELAETVLASLDGSPFISPGQLAGELARSLDDWAKVVAGTRKNGLTVYLEQPDDSGAWYLSVKAMGSDKKHAPVEQVIVNSSPHRSREVEADLQRLERFYPLLMRPGARRRGEVALDHQEAWELMSDIGPTLTDIGYVVNAPSFSKRKPVATLRLTSEESQNATVGAQQLANVTWSVAFGDVELSAEQVRELAADAKPLVQSHGKWVELDKIDLMAAAEALQEQQATTRLTGADMLRYALGLEGPQLSGGVSLAGEGWASNLLASAATISANVELKPEGFDGELRSYQAEARTWLGFLADAGLGGCLALDMGLGKTPTMLAHLRASKGKGPSLVIAPPAVVGNWASEAAKFTPGLKVMVHHGPSRTPESSLATMTKKHDVIITTYGTAVRDIGGLEGIDWDKVVLDEAQAIKNPTSETARQLRRLTADSRVALTGTPIENGLGDLWAILDFANPGLLGDRASFVSHLSADSKKADDYSESALKALNGILVFRRTKAEPAIAKELPDRIDELDHCAMTAEQIGLYQAVLDGLVGQDSESDPSQRKGVVLAAITALKQICNHPSAYNKDDTGPLEGRSGKLARLDEIIETVFASGERILVFTHFASWGEKLAAYLTTKHGHRIGCYHGGLSRGVRDKMVDAFQKGQGSGAMVVSLKAGGTGLNLTAANHVVLYDRWWNPAVEDQARDRVWRIGQRNTVICHRLVCPGTVDERVEEVVAGKRKIADLALPKSSSVGDLNAEQLQAALGLNPELLLTEDEDAKE